MSYYTLPSNLVAGTTARAEDVNDRMTGVSAGFTAAEADVSKRLYFSHASETLGDHTIALAPASRIGYLLQFDSSGKAVASNQLQGDIAANGKRITGLLDPVADSEPVSKGFLTTYSGAIAGVSAATGTDGQVLTNVAGTSFIWSGYTIPTVSGQTGKFLTNNGSAVSWAYPLPSGSQDAGSFLVRNATTDSWTRGNWNMIINSSGELGVDYWSGTTGVTSVFGAYGEGYYFSLPTGSFTMTTASFINAVAGSSYTLSFDYNTSGLTAGTLKVQFISYDSGGTPLSTQEVTLTNGLGWTNSSTTFVCPGSTAKVKVAINGVTITSTNHAIRKIKLEGGSTATPYESMRSWEGAYLPYLSSITMGSTQTSVTHTLGGSSATSSSYNMRSSGSGAQAYDVQLSSSGGTAGTPGKGTLGVTAAKVVLSQIIGFSSENDLGNSGAAITANLGDAANQKITLTASTTITVNVPSGITFRGTLKLVQNGTGGWTAAWAGTSITWAGGSGPSGSAFTAPNAVTFVSFYYDGTTLWGQWITY